MDSHGTLPQESPVQHQEMSFQNEISDNENLTDIKTESLVETIGERSRKSEYAEIFGVSTIPSEETFEPLKNGIISDNQNDEQILNSEAKVRNDFVVNFESSEFKRYEGKQQYPIHPRKIHFPVFDPSHSETNLNIFQSINEVLAYREVISPKALAFMSLDSKGKETANATWERVYLTSQKIARHIITKAKVNPREPVIILYRETDFVDFVIAFFGCLYSNTFPVPVVKFEPLTDLAEVLVRTKAQLILSVEHVINSINLNNDVRLRQLKNLQWLATDSIGLINLKNLSRMIPTDPKSVAYLEFCRNPTGEMRGVVISHENIMHQAFSIMANVQSIPCYTAEHTTDVLFSYIDPRQSIGLMVSVFFSVFSGIPSIFCSPDSCTTPGLLAHLLTKYEVSIFLADYPSLKTVAYNYQNDPKVTLSFARKLPVNLAAIRLAMIDCVTPDTEFNEILVDRWFKPLGNKRAREILCPILCLPEAGGLIVSMRDWIGKPDEAYWDQTESNKSCEDNFIRIALEKESLKANEVVIVAENEQLKRHPKLATDSVILDSFWYPIADMTVAVVDPDNGILCLPMDVGELWIQSPAVPMGFWDQEDVYDEIFQASPFVIENAELQPTAYPFKFCRTGLLGFIYKRKIFVLGMYEDRLRQKLEWEDDSAEFVEFRYYYTAHLIKNVMRKVPRVFDCSAFDMRVNDEYLPVIVLESPLATRILSSGSEENVSNERELLIVVAERCFECLLDVYQLRVYCVLITAPNFLPRITKNGRREIGNILTRNAIEKGEIPCVYAQFGTERSVFNLPIGTDPINGIFSNSATNHRHINLFTDEYQIFPFEPVKNLPNLNETSESRTILDFLQSRVKEKPDGIAYSVIDSKGKEANKISWKRLDYKAATVAYMLQGRYPFHSEDPVLLMYSHSEEYIFALYACFMLGVTPVVLQPIDALRLSEDVPALLSLISELKIKLILINQEVKASLKTNAVAHHLKQSIVASNSYLPPIVSTSKPPKRQRSSHSLGFQTKPIWLDPKFAALVLINWTPDQRRTLIHYSHTSIIDACKLHHNTLEMMNYNRPISFLGWIRSTSGIGFFHTCLMGVYTGLITYLLSPLDFALNPLILQQVTSKYNIPSIYITLQAFSHAFVGFYQKNLDFQLNSKLMVMHDSRPPVTFDRQFRQQALISNSISPIFHQAFNFLISCRHFTDLGVQEIIIDLRALRHGLIEIIHPDDPDASDFGLTLVDSGVAVPGTQIAIVNPENRQLCRMGELGEIWVSSHSNSVGIYNTADSFDLSRFNALIITEDGQAFTNETFLRTGDFGFLHTVKTVYRATAETYNVQLLYVLGGIGDTFSLNGLLYFTVDIESTVESSHHAITRGGSVVFQTGQSVILLAEVQENVNTNALASVTFVVTNAVLERHQLIFDTICFVQKGKFPRSRLNEKQRGRILASWFMNKIDLLASFPIRNRFQ